MDIAAVKFFWDVIKTVFGWVVSASKIQAKPSDTSPLSVARRFVELFEAHGVKRSQISKFFGRGLELRHFIDDEALLGELTEERLQAVTDLFGIKRTWLDGTSSEIYDIHSFYKRPEEFKKFLDGLLKEGNTRGGDLLTAKEATARDYNALLIIEEEVGVVGEVPVYRYHLCGNWIFEYWKCRAYITACVAYAWEKNAYIHGRKLPEKDIIEYATGTRFLEVCDWGGGLGLTGKRFHADDLADNPTVYLDTVDEGMRGKLLGLELWLDLESKGFMRNGYGEPERQAFEEALNLVSEYVSMNILQKFLYRRNAIKTGTNLFVFQ